MSGDAVSYSRGAVLGAVLLAAGCASDSSVNKYVPQIVTPYRMDIQQGNFVTQDMVDKLQKGQTRDQVRFILGTPLLTDVFHATRWDYIFRFSKGWQDPEKHRLTVFFGADDKLESWDADVPPPKSAAPVAEEKSGLFGGLFSKSEPAKPAAIPAGDSAGAQANSSATVSPAAASAAAAAAPAASDTAPANPAAANTALSATPAEKEPEKKPSALRRMFGWLPGLSTEDAVANTARAASPDPSPTPRPAIATPPSAPVEPAPAPMAPIGGTVSAVPPPVTITDSQPAAVASAPAAPVPADAVPAATPAPAPAAAAASQQEAVSAGVLASVERWRAAWQAKDLTRYFAAYAPDFRPPNNLPRAKWEAQRRDRLSKPTFIVVTVRDAQVKLGRDDAAVAVFVQEYESDLLKESGRKTLKLARYGNDWLIVEENPAK